MQTWASILETAIHAPSPHNVQPWRVKIVDEGEAELYIDSTRTLPKEDLTGSFIILTMGLFLEAVRILAARQGLSLQYELFNEPDWYAPAILQTKIATLLPFAKMRLTPSEVAEEPYSPELFHRRRTCRISLRPDLIDPEIVAGFQKLAAEWNQRFEVTTDRELIEEILRLNTEALFEDLNTPGYHDEITEWFRYTDKQALRHLDGLDYRCMNTHPAHLWLSARTPFLLKTPVVSGVLGKIYRSQLGPVPTLAVIAGGFWEPADAIEAGKFLMRFWLETARHNLYIHPYGNLVTNRPAAALMEEALGISDIWLVFKIGYSDEPPKSHRLPLERILVY